MIYFCCDDRRREAVDDDAVLNGIDFLEVLDHEAPAGSPRQRTLLVRLLKPVGALGEKNVFITGGERITPVRVQWARAADAVPNTLANAAERAFFTGLEAPDQVLVVRTDSSGDFSPYVLRLVQSLLDVTETPPANFDPLLSRVEFTFKAECPTDFDCVEPACPQEPLAEPEISYLAKDYGSFRRLMLDRMAAIMPAWSERSPADLGVTLVELLAYVGDHLSYQQDAIATEAYLGTARRRISVRRHARLVDYRMHDGSNARVFLHLRIDPAANQAPPIALPSGAMVLTRVTGHGRRIPKADPKPPLDIVLREEPTVFETLHAARLFVAHNEIRFYTWGDRDCCLAKGAMRATLRGPLPNLGTGDVLVFEEVRGPRTGRPEDADLTKRHAVRLVAVVRTDHGGNPLVDPLNDTAIVEIRWHADDALPFPLCLSAHTDKEHGSLFIDDVSVARGNIVLADHGRTLTGDALGSVPQPHLFVAEPDLGHCTPSQRTPVPPRFRPRLRERPLTQAAPYEPATPPDSAFATLHWSLNAVRPSRMMLRGSIASTSNDWFPVPDLLASGPADRNFVPESEADGTVFLRFGDGRHGTRPQSDTSFVAGYRIGNGMAGNVGADAIIHVVTDEARIVGVRNPLPARGGIDPEQIEDVRQRAPFAFRTQQRAVTETDYAEKTALHPDVQRAAAMFRWTGSWHTAFVTVDRDDARPITDQFEQAVRGHLEPFRMAGYDLEVDGPRFVPVELDLFVCVKPNYFRADVKAALLESLGSRVLPDGRRGLFHPDNFTFQQPVYLSAIYAAAQSVTGVASVEITRFQRQGEPSDEALTLGRMDMGRLEIARLDSDRNFPEHGVLRLELAGGK